MLKTNMRFRQLDRILEIQPGKSLKAIRHVHAQEDYLRDHFPLFKVMPGVLMLEALFQASCWLIRTTENFHHSLLVLKEARNVKFADFMEPGQTLELTIEIVKQDESTVTMKATGTKGEIVAVSARLIIGKNNLGNQDKVLEATDAMMRDRWKEEFAKLQPTGQGHSTDAH